MLRLHAAELEAGNTRSNYCGFIAVIGGFLERRHAC
jgi:hypothetical protein